MWVLFRILGSKIERLAVLVSGHGESKLLGIPKIKNSSGVSQAKAVLDCLFQWNLGDKIIGMCFDTTSTNTGGKNGACTILEQKLNKNLLYFACRHHVLELVLKAAFEVCFDVSQSPNILLFEKFKSEWDHINFSKSNVLLSFS